MEQPNLSIITINYNDAEGLRKTMDSVLNQTYSNFELIIVDGGSTDKSVDYIKQNEDLITHWVSEKDKGVFNAQNKGITASKGRYLLFLNSGDILNGNTALQDFIEHDNFDGEIIYGDYKFENGEKVYEDNLTLYYFMKTSLPHQSTFFKRSVFDEMGSYDEKYSIAADRAFFIKCFVSNKYKFQHIKYPLTIFDLTGVSNDPSFLKAKEVEDEAVFKEYFGKHYEDLIQQREDEKAQFLKRRNSIPGIIKRIKKRLS